MTTIQKLAWLKEQIAKASTNIYERVVTAAEILADVDWVARTHEGSESMARATLAADYFHDMFNGPQMFDQLLEIYHEFPKRQQWAQHKFNLTRLWAAVEEKRAANREKGTRDSCTVAERDRLIATASRLKAQRDEALTQANEVKTAIAVKDESIARLRQEVANLQRENASLRLEVEQLQHELSQARMGELVPA